ncbi:unnamed protein product, partial [Sphagnum tenellum]
PDRKFVEVEMAFFWMWWNQATGPQRESIKKFLKSGQLEFIGGGWSMNDEAAVHFISTIDNMSVGHRFISETFGPQFVPVIGWQIDPFGHSSWLASAFADMGFIGEYFARIDHDDQVKRENTKTLEMIWRGSNSRPGDSDIFTQKLYSHYSPLSGFYWEHEYDNPAIDESTHVERVNLYISEVLEQASHYRTNHIMNLMGEDFTYKPSSTWYANMDKLMYYANQDGRVNVFYSTPSNFTKAVNQVRANWTDTLKTDDFFPYADNPHAYWSGYFTTRPSFKRMERRGSNILQAARQIEVATGGRVAEGTGITLDTFEREMGISQHHDAITGNNKQAVANDYAKRLSAGINDGVELIKERIGQLTQVEDLCYCALNNQTRCECTADLNSVGQSLNLVVYNSLSSKRQQILQVPVQTANIKVTDVTTGETLRAQVIPVSAITKGIPAETKGGLPAVNNFVVHFEAPEIPAMGFSTYSLTVVDASSAEKAQLTTPSTLASIGDVMLSTGDGNIKLQFKNGQLAAVENAVLGVTIPVQIEYLYYSAYCGYDQNDGEYIFRPDGTSATPLVASKIQVTVATGDLVTEVSTSYDLASSVIRIRTGSSLVEVEHTVDSIPVLDRVGKEIIVRYSTDLKTAGTFYTDSNGRELQRRQKDHRDTWDLDLVNEPIARNYFPVNTAGILKDEANQVTVLVDRSEGAASLADGQVEFMLHRRLMCDDGRGASQVLNELGPDGKGLKVRISHYLAFTDSESGPTVQKLEQAKVFAEPILVYSKPSSESVKTGVSQFSFVAGDIPSSVIIPTLQDLGKGRVLFRLAHLFEVDEDKVHSSVVKLDIQALFPSLKINNITEMQLTADTITNSNSENSFVFLGDGSLVVTTSTGTIAWRNGYGAAVATYFYLGDSGQGQYCTGAPTTLLGGDCWNWDLMPSLQPATTVAGSGAVGSGGNSGTALSVQLSAPSLVTKVFTPANGYSLILSGNLMGLAFDPKRNLLYGADAANNVVVLISTGLFGQVYAGTPGQSGYGVRVVDFISQTISTVAGNGLAGYSGDGGSAAAAQLNHPYGVAVDSRRRLLFITDTALAAPTTPSGGASDGGNATDVITTTSTTSLTTTPTSKSTTSSTSNSVTMIAVHSPRVISVIAMHTIVRKMGNVVATVGLNWDTSSDPCVNSWQGVTCDNSDQNIIGISLISDFISTPINLQVFESLEFISSLQSITIGGDLVSGHSLVQGTLPASWGSLSSLIHLDLSFNALTGTIPDEWSQMRSLQKLYLEGNLLESTLPASFSNLVELRTFRADINKLSGTLPDSWGALVNMQELYLTDNNFVGYIPFSWKLLPKWNKGDLRANALSLSPWSDKRCILTSRVRNILALGLSTAILPLLGTLPPT